MITLTQRHRLVAFVLGGVVLTAAGIAFALDCPSPAPQRAQLELVGVTVDGAPQTDLSPYSGLRFELWGATSGTDGTAPGAQFLGRAGAGDRYYYGEWFGVAIAPDR